MPRERDERDREITFEIREHLGVLATRSSGWRKELNVVVWNGNEPGKFDVRDWNEDHSKMSRGITLFADEMKNLVRLYHLYQSRNVIDAARSAEEDGEDDESAGGGGTGRRSRPARKKKEKRMEESVNAAEMEIPPAAEIAGQEEGLPAGEESVPF